MELETRNYFQIKYLESAPIAGKWEINPGLHFFKLIAPRIAGSARPGQFVEIDPGEEFFLRRPFSIQDAYGDTVEILVKVVGKGTAKLVEREDAWNLLGPLGNEFSRPEGMTPVLVGGGVGVAPLKFLFNTLNRSNIEVKKFLIGAQTAAEIPIHIEDPIRGSLTIATDDGSEGFRGTVVDLLKQTIDSLVKPYIYACGPQPMLTALRKFMLEKGLDGEFSIESRMACGMGVCQGCAVPVGQGFKLVCRDGPVFRLGEGGEGWN